MKLEEELTEDGKLFYKRIKKRYKKNYFITEEDMFIISLLLFKEFYPHKKEEKI
jgi:hypothetical protein